MLRKAAMVFGIVFVLIGLLGFVPGLTPTGPDGRALLLGIFEVDTSHNFVHLLSGIVALVASSRLEWSRLYFQVFGVIYGLVTVLGLFMDPVLGFLPVNPADNVLHLVITIAALYFGFFYKGDRSNVTRVSV